MSYGRPARQMWNIHKPQKAQAGRIDAWHSSRMPVIGRHGIALSFAIGLAGDACG
jgi:hypothetical protein